MRVSSGYHHMQFLHHCCIKKLKAYLFHKVFIILEKACYIDFFRICSVSGSLLVVDLTN